MDICDGDKRQQHMGEAQLPTLPGGMVCPEANFEYGIVGST